MDLCDCRLCREYQTKENVIFESDNFFVVPSIGQIVEGYLLICSKQHFISVSQFPQKLLPEFEEIKSKVRDILTKYYIAPIFFEHGPTAVNKKGGCCVEHAHLHAVPVNVDILVDLLKNFQAKKIEDFSPLVQQLEKNIPYFYYENQAGGKYLFELSDPVSSQYLRQLVAVKINQKDKWDWMQYPGWEEFKRVIEKLKTKF